MQKHRRRFLAGAGAAGLWSALSPAEAAAGWLCGRKRRAAPAVYGYNPVLQSRRIGLEPQFISNTCALIAMINVVDVPEFGDHDHVVFGTKYQISVKVKHLNDRTPTVTISDVMNGAIHWCCDPPYEVTTGSGDDPISTIKFWAKATHDRKRPAGPGSITITITPGTYANCVGFYSGFGVTYL